MTIFVRHGGELIDEVKRGADVRILIVDPRCSATNELYGRDRSTYSANLGVIRLGIERVYREIAGAPGSFEVRVVEDSPNYGLVVGEKESRSESVAILHIYFNYTRLGADRPVLAIGTEDRWFPIFVNEFNTAWGSAKSWAEVSPQTDPDQTQGAPITDGRNGNLQQ
jgi:hypothetical protein